MLVGWWWWTWDVWWCECLLHITAAPVWLLCWCQFNDINWGCSRSPDWHYGGRRGGRGQRSPHGMGQPSHCPHQSSPILASVYIDIHDVCRQVCVCPIPSAVSPATPATLIPRVSQIPPTSIPIWMGASSLGRASSASPASDPAILHNTPPHGELIPLHVCTLQSCLHHPHFVAMEMCSSLYSFCSLCHIHFCNITI